jgi:hypothetical protein
MRDETSAGKKKSKSGMKIQQEMKKSKRRVNYQKEMKNGKWRQKIIKKEGE